MEGSKKDSWRYVILFCKFSVGFLDSGLAKSFGVLIPRMVARLKVNYTTVGLLCSLPGTLQYLACLIMPMILEVVSLRLVAMAGGLVSGVCLMLCAFTSNIGLLGLFLALTGVGFASVFMTTFILLNEYFQDKLVMANTISLYGYTAGTMILPFIAERSLEAYGYSGAFIILGGLMLNNVAIGAAVRPLKAKKRRQQSHNKSDCNLEHRRTIDEARGSRGEDDLLFNRIEHDKEQSRSRVKEGKGSNAHEQIVALVEQHQGNGAISSDVKHGPITDETKDDTHERIPFLNELRQGKGEPLDQVKDRQGNDMPGEKLVTLSTEHQGDEDIGSVINGHETRIGEDDEIVARRSLLDIDDEQNSDRKPSIEDINRSYKEGSVPSTSRNRSSFKAMLREEYLFFISLPALVLNGYIVYSWFLFLVPHAVQLGFLESQAVFLSSIGGIGGVMGRTLFIILLAKDVDLFTLYIVIGFVGSLSFILDFVGTAYAFRAGLAFIQGICIFIEDTLPSTFSKMLVMNDDNFNIALALIMFCVGIGATAAGVLSGFLIDITQSSTKLFIINGGIHLIMVIYLIVIKVLLMKKTRIK